MALRVAYVARHLRRKLLDAFMDVVMKENIEIFLEAIEMRNRQATGACRFPWDAVSENSTWSSLCAPTAKGMQPSANVYLAPHLRRRGTFLQERLGFCRIYFAFFRKVQ